MRKRKHDPIRINDFVTFHTQYGSTVGIVEQIYFGNPQIAYITVRTMFGKPKRYYRPLYKLKKAELCQSG